MAAKSVEAKVKNGLLPTPPMAKGLPKAQLTDNARQVLMKRYVRRGDDGKPAENVEEMFWRVAYHVAKVEEQWGADVQQRTLEYYHLLSSKKFFPNSPTFTGAGTPLGQLAACFVLPITDDMGRDSAGIFQTLRDAALIQQTGGGNGFSFSRHRPGRRPARWVFFVSTITPSVRSRREAAFYPIRWYLQTRVSCGLMKL
jgi:ribonucleoside-diphosphate reductase alpha chain